MRTLLVALAILGSAAAFAARADEPRTYDERALPRTEEGLSALDAKQLSIVRRATNQCDATETIIVRTSVRQRPCIISRVDHAIETSGDPALQAYHAALPFNARYDRYRSSYYYQQILIRVRK
ncbi:MAG: hypothetical protein GC190_02880 [Alphaproteobacteria bacterium]|nr:hypothetical protein [Alphaproteobacteria bacterium]